MNRAPQSGTLAFLVRGAGYAATSATCIVAGYLAAAGLPVSDDLLLLLGVLSSTFPFFVAYAVKYHFDDPSTIHHEGLLLKAQKEALIISGLAAVALSTLFVCLYRISSGKFPNSNIALAGIVYFLLFTAYAFFLTTRITNPALNQTRHQLVWPVLLSIGVSFYSGLFFQTLRTSLRPLWAFAVLAVSFFALQLLPRRHFRNLGLFAIGTLIVSVSFGWITTPLVSSAMFALAIAAYLSVFESWRITAHIGAFELSQNRIPVQADWTDSSRQPTTFQLWYFASLIALVLSGLSVPLLYAFTKLNDVFLGVFAIHFAVSFAIWFQSGSDARSLARGMWVTGKTVFGFVFLLLLVVDAQIVREPSNPFMPRFTSFDGLAVLVVLLTTVFVVIARTNPVRGFDPFSRNSYLSRRVILLGAATLGTILCGIVLLSHDLTPNTKTGLKLDRAFVAYAFYTIAAVVASLVITFKGKGPQQAVSVGLAVVASARWFTSTMIGVTVVVPAVLNGIQVGSAVMLALPFSLAAAGGFLLNDAFDKTQDQLNKPHRPIPQGRLEVETAIGAALVLLGAGSVVIVVIAEQTAWEWTHWSATLGVVLYNVILKKWGWAKPAFAAGLSVLPLVWVAGELPSTGIEQIAVATTFLFLLGRELQMDVLDKRGDVRAGIRTLPAVWGDRRTLVVTSLAHLLAIAGLFLIASLDVTTQPQRVTAAASACAIGVFLVAWPRVSISKQRRIIGLHWLPMCCGIALLA
jgi:4-hydroxybenzoate polyprenyltransferase